LGYLGRVKELDTGAMCNHPSTIGKCKVLRKAAARGDTVIIAQATSGK